MDNETEERLAHDRDEECSLIFKIVTLIGVVLWGIFLILWGIWTLQKHVKKIAIEGWEWDTDPYIFNSSEVHPFSLPE